MKTSALPFNTVYVIGAGGVASWLLPALLKLLNQQWSPPQVVVFDGDTLEEKNLDRQLFPATCIGTNKATALADVYRGGYNGTLVADTRFFTEGFEGVARNALYLVCVDNHAARKAALEAVDVYGGRAVFGANEYTDAEAYIYEPAWRDTPLDPRVFYPVIKTDTTNDPVRPQSCQGVAAAESPQLVLANLSAATLMLWLVWFHYMERPGMSKAETFDYWPHHHRSTFSRFSTVLAGHTTKKG